MEKQELRSFIENLIALHDAKGIINVLDNKCESFTEHIAFCQNTITNKPESRDVLQKEIETTYEELDTVKKQLEELNKAVAVLEDAINKF